MNYSFEYIDIILLAMIAGFIFLRLRGILGKKTRHEEDMASSFAHDFEFKKTNLTEFYNLIYEYKNDCLVAAIEYNKDYYSDRDIKPNEELFFSLTIIPFSKISSPNTSQ